MTETDFDPTPYIVPNDEPHPNPYEDPDFDGKQDAPPEAPQDEGLGGTFNNNAETRLQWRDWHDSGTTKLPDGQDIHMHCLSAVRQARGIGALYYSAKDQAEKSLQRFMTSYETIDWSKVPQGSPLIYRVGQYWHISHFLMLTKVGPLTWTTDVPSNQVSLVDPIYFRLHWGAELDSVLGDLEGVDLMLGQHGGDGSGGSGGDGGQTQDGVKWKKADDGAHALWVVRGYLTAAVGVVDAIQQQWPDIEETKASVHDALAKVNHARSTLHDIAHPPEGKK